MAARTHPNEEREEEREAPRRMSPGVTYDTGMLIALERHKLRALQVHERLRERHISITVPLAVLGEWWRGRTDDREDILRSVEVELGEMARMVAQLAGEALGDLRPKKQPDACPSKYLVDAVVMASASLRGDVVYTCEFDDLSRFSRRFPMVRLLSP
jgi:hypothetical protein